MNAIEYADLASKLDGLSIQITDLSRDLHDIKDKPTKDLLYQALAKAKLEYKPLRFNRTNTFNKQVYADLEAIQRATNNALSNAGLTFIQAPVDVDGTTYLDSILGHCSGQELSYRNRLIIPEYTGANSNNQRYGEALAYLKRQVAQAMLGIVACNDEADNDDADTSEYIWNKQATKAIAGDERKAIADDGIMSERITKSELEDLRFELDDYPVTLKAILKRFGIKELADLPKSMYQSTIRDIRERKMMLRDKDRKEW
jgi:hypothetical protein